jgi:malonyl-ACP decarboxylase
MNEPRRWADRVVVTGLGVICSIGADPVTFTAALREGRCGIDRVDGGPGVGWQLAAPIRDFVFADAVAKRTGLSDALLQHAQQVAGRAPFGVQVATVSALQAWEGAALAEAPLDPNRIGLVVSGNNLTGRYAQQWEERFDADPHYLTPRFALHFQDTDHVGLISHVLGITGEGFTVGAASASGNAGLVAGSRLIQAGLADACLVVGALVDLSSMQMRSFLNLGAMAADPGEGGAPAAPFDKGHCGFVYGQGAACLVLESEHWARTRRVPVLAELAGYGVALDANSLANPSEQGEVRVMTDALRMAAIQPAQLSYVSTHGTGAVLGDRTELAALRRVLGPAVGIPWVNATKGMTGHCLAAAGVVEAVATVIQMREGFVHANVGLTEPIDTEYRFVGPVAEDADIEYAMSNSFGFGGFNSSIVLAGRSRG